MIAGETWSKGLGMGMDIGETLGDPPVDATEPREWVSRVIALLDTAARQLDHERVAQHTIREAASLLRKQIVPEPAECSRARGGGLPALHARTVCAYIDSHIADRILVADLSALVHLSEAHFSRVFRRKFGKSPHAFVITRRVEFAARYMLQTDASLSAIALQCGFADQAHLCKHFRGTMGRAPAAWRREHTRDDDAEQQGAALTFGPNPDEAGSFSADGAPAHAGVERTLSWR
jgi:AraC family transcriptional regulator